MIRHIAMFHLTDAADSEGRDKVISDIKASVANITVRFRDLSELR